jgi:hypothetical protein
MPDQLQLRGGTTVQHSTFTGASKEVTVDTTKKTVVVHDGTTAGGIPVMREDASNSALGLGSAGTPSIKFTGDTNTGIYSPGADQVAVATNGTGRLFVDANGNVALGTASASASWGRSIKIQGISNAAVEITDGTITTELISAAGSYGIVGTSSNHPFYIRTNGQERLRITNDGLVGVGTSSPSHILTATTSGNNVFRAWTTDTGTSNQIVFDNSGNFNYGVIGSISSNGTATGDVFGLGYAAAFVTDFTPVLSWTANTGRVGIGTSVPATALEVLGFIQTQSGAFAGGGYNIRYTSDASSRSWQLLTDNTAYGDFTIQQSTTQTGSTYTPRLYISAAGNVGIGTTSPSSLLHLADAGNITVGTTTGTKIGTATTQKLGFYNSTPVVQPAAVANATTAIDVITQLNDLLAKLRTLGIIAT